MPRKGGSNRTTLTEVARAAGVSPATASMVLSGKGEDVRIASATAARVRAVALDLDYSPNLLVRSLQQGSTGVLAFFSAFRVVSDEDAYMDRMNRVLERAAGRRGYDLLIHCAYDRPIEETYRAINGGRADGLVLFAPRPDDPILALMRRSRLPCVLLNTRDPEGVLPSVKDDYENGMALVAQALVQNGHRRIACVHVGPNDSPDAAERIAALDRSLAELGVVRPEGLTINLQHRLNTAIEELVTSPEPPTAIFCCTDHIAYHCLVALDRLGVRIPEQLSLIGYDGIRWPFDVSHRAASVVVDFNAQATAAVGLLLDGCERGDSVTIPTSFDPGTTLGPISSTQRSN
ncbi:LacI family transcriptional regulator [bacterium]|nr:MAG: LacI family transcriptional regulator [bacterium]